MNSNDPPYGTERSYKACAWQTHSRKQGMVGDAATSAGSGQTTPNGYLNIERMLKILTSKGGKIGVCGSCMDVRGLSANSLVPGSHRSSIEELTCWTWDADKVLVF